MGVAALQTPLFGYLLSKKGGFDNWETIDDPFNTDNIKRFDFSIFGGLGYKFDDNVFVETRYIHGLTETSKVYGSKNRNIQISLGYLF